ncbi:hypothetical protein [Paludibacterium denitrificans]|uniref:Uncharacterized protein n=1 Tax=Paludibacterium denitrificans TaxID=2675226 RepID=A0A844GBV6_9NEIS|nr:hypothetical protein [Paludibacterium denitrificans]MTD33119.1 hypothetical protein [Paludibacterium denitrificans]
MILFTELLRSPAGIMSLIGMLLALAKFGWIIGYFIIKSHEELKMTQPLRQPAIRR